MATSGPQSVDALISQIKALEDSVKHISRVINRTSEELSKAGVDKFAKELKEAAKQSGILNEEQLDVIKSLRDLEKAIDLQESQADKIRGLQKKRDKEIADAMRFEEKVRKDLVFNAKKQYSADVLNLGLSHQQADALVASTDAFKKNTDAIAKNISKHDYLNKSLETMGSGLKKNITEFATLASAASLLKKAFLSSYEQMNRLTQKGMLGAFTSINLMAPKLLLLPEELEQLVNKNRDLVNAFGGGIHGLERFGEELGKARNGLEYLGKEGTKAASRFMETSKVLGLTAKNGKAYDKVMTSMKKQFREFSGLFGDSYEEYAQLIEAQAQDENYRRRLNMMSEDRIVMEVAEMQKRTENLKLMGLSNQQIIEFNKRLEDMYNPRKNTQVQRRSEAVMFGNMQANMTNMLSSNPAMAAQLAAIQATAGTGRQVASLHAQGRGSELKNLLASPEGRAFLKAQADAGSAIDANFSDTSRYGINTLRERSGGLGSLIDGVGLQAQTADAQKRSIDPGSADALKKSAMDLTGANSMLESGFKATTVAMEGLRAIMGNPLAVAAAGAVAGLLAVASASGLASKAMAMGRGAIGGKAGKLGMLGRLGGSFIKGGGVLAAGAFAAGEVGSLVSAGKQLWDAKTREGITLTPEAQSRVNSMGSGANSSIQGALAYASQATGVSPGLLTAIAKKESNFDANAKASTSTATGLFQFTNGTWLSTIRKHGHKHGINTSGMTEGQILGLRTDPKISALMGAELVKENQSITGNNTAGGAYLAHFLGASGAKRVLAAPSTTPISQLVTPDQMKANASIFSKYRTAGSLQGWANSAMGMGDAPITTSPSTSPSATPSDSPAEAELKKQTALLAAIAANTGIKIRPSGNAYKADSATVAKDGM